jgi:hypothetical protein
VFAIFNATALALARVSTFFVDDETVLCGTENV